MHFLSNFFLWKTCLIFFNVFFYCAGARITTLMSVSDRLHQYFLRPKMEKRRSMKEEKDGEVFTSRQSRHFSFIELMIQVLFLIYTLNWRVINYVYRQRYGIKGRNGSKIIILLISAYWYCTHLLKSLGVCFR